MRRSAGPRRSGSPHPPPLLSLQVLFYVSPVSRLVGALMALLSLFPGQELFSLTLK